MASAPPHDAPGDGGRRARKALAARHALFDAGLAAFERQPIDLVSVLDITEAADVAKGVFYLHFRSRDEYLLALWAHVDDALIERVEAAVSGQRSLTARLEGIVAALLQCSGDEPRAVRFRLRMAAYLPDDIGPPGELSRLRHAHLKRLAIIIAGGADPSRLELDLATTVDACCWGLIGEALSLGAPLPERSTLMPIVMGALRAVQRG